MENPYHSERVRQRELTCTIFNEIVEVLMRYDLSVGDACWYLEEVKVSLGLSKMERIRMEPTDRINPKIRVVQ